MFGPIHEAGAHQRRAHRLAQSDKADPVRH
jgi:hypothetical protein